MPRAPQPICNFPPMSLQERELLERLYIKKNLSAAQIAEKLHCAERTIFNRLKAHGISREHPVTGIKNIFPPTNYCPHCGQEWIK